MRRNIATAAPPENIDEGQFPLALNILLNAQHPRGAPQRSTNQKGPRQPLSQASMLQGLWPSDWVWGPP